MLYNIYMSSWNNAVLPSVSWPVITQDVTLWENGQTAKVSLDISNVLFSTLEDYDNCFSTMDTSISVFEQLAKKNTKEYNNMKSNIREELNQLKELLKATSHYKALLLMKTDESTTDQIQQKPTTATSINNEVIASQARVILENADIKLNHIQVGVIDKHYRAIFQQWATDLQSTPIVIDEQPKKITINDDMSAIVARLFERVNNPVKSKPTTSNEKPSWILSKLTIFGKNKQNSSDETVYHHKPMWIITVKNSYGRGEKSFVLRFIDSGQKLKNQLVGSVEFETISSQAVEELGSNIPHLQINHPSYIEQKVR
jgi:ElaB/YqjD/DUF883 family membrane-anchored ribosome-binding protein